MSIISPLDEAEFKVMIREIYKSKGAYEVIIILEELLACAMLILQTLIECNQKDKSE